MKTCLYNPVFINPLAYYVFPLLYAMLPKTDDLIEYAKYTGQLIVTDVTNNDTYTVYSRSNSIDLSDFAEKRIRISLYTNTGAVLLGEWNMPEGGLPKPIAAWSAAGKTNEDEDRAVLKDLTGNGHDITLNGFAFSEMSGYGGYAQNYNIIANTKQELWKPSLETASLWKVVDEEHAGTQEDPIPYNPPMEIFKDKYYTQNEVLYKCTRNSEIPLSHNLSALVGTYVELV